MLGVSKFFAALIALHADIELGWQGFVLCMVGIFLVVWFFDRMAGRAIKKIHRHRSSSIVSRLKRRQTQIGGKLIKLLSRARR
jgi:hypothetical protein